MGKKQGQGQPNQQPSQQPSQQVPVLKALVTPLVSVEDVITQITEQIYRSRDLQEILQNAVREIHQVVQCDRVVIYQLDHAYVSAYNNAYKEGDDGKHDFRLRPDSRLDSRADFQATAHAASRTIGQTMPPTTPPVPPSIAPIPSPSPHNEAIAPAAPDTALPPPNPLPDSLLKTAISHPFSAEARSPQACLLSCTVKVEAVHPAWTAMLGQQLQFPVEIIDLARQHDGHCRRLTQAITDFLLMETLQPYQLRSRLFAPIWLQIPDSQHQELWGGLALHQCAAEREWDDAECKLLERVVRLLAIAIQQARRVAQIEAQGFRFEQQVQAQTAQLRQALQNESTLKRITDKVRDSLDEEQIIQNAVHEVELALKVGSCNAALYDLERGISTIRYESANFIPAEKGRVSQLANFSELYSQLLIDKQYFQFCSLMPNPVRGRVAMLACPMFDNQGVLGDIWLVHHCDHIFSDLEIRLVQQVANQCAIAIRQARLYQAAQAQVAELEKLNRLKDDFLSTVSHELKSPISTIKMAIEMLNIHLNQIELETEVQTRLQRYISIVQEECTRESELVNDLLDLQRLEDQAYAVAMSVIDMEKWVNKMVRSVRGRLDYRQQSLVLDVPKMLNPLVTDRVILDRIILELLNNASKYSANDTQLHLQVREVVFEHLLDAAGAQRTGVELAVTNPAEIPPDELPKIFSKFYRIPNADPWKQGGTGLGLALVDRLVNELGGTITVHSANDTTTFKVRIPNDQARIQPGNSINGDDL